MSAPRSPPWRLLGLALAALASLAIASCDQEQDAARTTTAAAAPAAPPPVAAQPTAPTPPPDLDRDGNGLYDDRERAAVLAALVRGCPALAGERFDADGDGTVTIAEMAQGRHPLSCLIPAGAAPAGIPWTIDLFPEWISTAFIQEDAAPGPLASLAARGTIPATATQADAARQPQRAPGRGGIAFAPGAHLTLPGRGDARWSYRWCVLTFCIDATTAGRDATVLVDINRGQRPGMSSPRIWYERGTGLSVQYLGRGAQGVDRRVLTGDIVADGRSWNVLVCGMRQGRLFAAVNGTPLRSATPQPARYSTEPASADAVSCLGDPAPGGMPWACDALVLGITEPSEAMVDKLGGWAAHRLGFADRLPDGHPYRQRRPVLDDEDLPHRYVHDDAAWLAWGQGLTKERVRANTGGPRVEPQGFERVFLDDFRRHRIAPSTSAEADLWAGPGWNSAVGAGVPLLAPGRQPDLYPHDAAAGTQTLALGHDGKRWFGSACYTVNDLGQGYTWAGAKIFRIRCRFPRVPRAELAPGLFPAFWSYGSEFLYWRTSNRIEIDWFEFDGKEGSWLNGVATHFHYPHLKSVFARSNDSYKRFKVLGARLSEELLRVPGGLQVWDGAFHTWEFVVDRDMFYINVTVEQDGQERWIELARCPPAPTYHERVYLLLDYALKLEKNGAGAPPLSAGRQDFVIDWIEVLQRTEEVRRIPPPFASRPTLAGEARPDGMVICQAHVPGISDVRYYWFADGYPLGYGAEPSWRLPADAAGTRIRCQVKAVGARDMPEAWSDPLPVPVANAAPPRP